MILIDFSQVMISSLMMQINNDPNLKIEENLVRHIALNTIRYYISQFGKKFGKIVICCDFSGSGYWRKQKFQFYKSNRKETRDKSQYNWEEIFNVINKIKLELKEFFPYKVIEIERCEADDIIAVLTKRFCTSEQILIVSSDKDFYQLLQYDSVFQYSPKLKTFITIKKEEIPLLLKEHIAKGDKGDGIPNCLSDSDTFMNPSKRQVVMSKERLKNILSENNPKEKFPFYSRNDDLINFNNIPEEYTKKIIEKYMEYPTIKINNETLLNFFISKRLSNLIEHLQEFVNGYNDVGAFLSKPSQQQNNKGNIYNFLEETTI